VRKHREIKLKGKYFFLPDVFVYIMSWIYLNMLSVSVNILFFIWNFIIIEVCVLKQKVLNFNGQILSYLSQTYGREKERDSERELSHHYLWKSKRRGCFISYMEEVTRPRAWVSFLSKTTSCILCLQRIYQKRVIT
jgi:hypothetical protein